MVKSAPRFKISRWVMLSLSILLNSFIIFYSCLTSSITNAWNTLFTGAYTKIINDLTEKEVENIPLENIAISFSSEENHKYNYISGYQVSEIPLGSEKQIECSFSPINATNQGLTYSVIPSDAAILNQSGSNLSVVGMKVGNAKIRAESKDGNFVSEVDFKVVNPVAPLNFSITSSFDNLQVGFPKKLDFQIDGGNLGNNDLVTFRYFDTRLLNYESSDETVATVDENGVIYPHHIGSTTISVSNGTIVREKNITVTPGGVVPSYDNLQITGDTVCYANEMILDQTSNKNQHKLKIKNGEEELKAEDFIWTSSNELLVKVDKNGVVRGFRKVESGDLSATITAKSIIDGSEATFTITVKNQRPTKLDYSVTIGDTLEWHPSTCICCVGDVVDIKLYYSPSTQEKDVIVYCSNDDIVEISNEGEHLKCLILKEGDCNIKLTSIINDELVIEMKFSAVKAGAIKTSDVGKVNLSLRKTVGHASVFMFAQIFTFLALYMFLYNKKWWLYSSISLGEGLFISALSELIQYFIPTRGGTFLDVVINFAGVVVGFTLAFLTLLLIKKIIKKKKEPQNK